MSEKNIDWCLECGASLLLEMERDHKLCVNCQAEKGITPEECECTLTFNKRDIELFNQWFDSISDKNNRFLTHIDYALALKLKNYLGIVISTNFIKKYTELSKEHKKWTKNS